MAGFSVLFRIPYSKFHILPKILDIAFDLYIIAGLLHMSIGIKKHPWRDR